MPYDGIGPHQLTDAMAVYVFHMREIEHEFLRAFSRGNVNQIAKFGVAVR